MPPRYRKLAALYFFYFAGIGIYLPYWSPYLRSLGFSAAEIGELLAIFLATKLFAPYIWGWVADRTAQRLLMLRLAAGLSVIFFSLILLRDGYVWLAVILFFSSFFFNAFLPQLESVTMDNLGHMSRHYSRIRLWGSVGFIACAVGVAPLIDRIGIWLTPYLIFGAAVAIWLVALRCVDRRAAPASSVSILPQLARVEVLCLLALCFVVQLTHTPYYAFFTIYMSDMGYGRTLIGQLWALGVICEVGIFLVVPVFLARWGAPALLSFSMLITALRWFLLARFPHQLPLVLFAQTLHAVTFGVYHAAAIQLINRWFPGVLRGRGQALYLAVSFGLGGALGSLFVGRLWDAFGGGEVFLLAAMLAVGGALLTVPLYRRGLQAQVAETAKPGS